MYKISYLLPLLLLQWQEIVAVPLQLCPLGWHLLAQGLHWDLSPEATAFIAFLHWHTVTTLCLAVSDQYKYGSTIHVHVLWCLPSVTAGVCHTVIDTCRCYCMVTYWSHFYSLSVPHRQCSSQIDIIRSFHVQWFKRNISIIGNSDKTLDCLSQYFWSLVNHLSTYGMIKGYYTRTNTFDEMKPT